MQSKFTLDSYRREIHDLIFPTWFDRLAAWIVRGWYEHKRLLREEMGDYIEKELRILDSMTAQERRTPTLIDEERQKRISAAAGVSTKDVRQLLRSYEQFRDIKEGRGLPSGDSPPPF